MELKFLGRGSAFNKDENNTAAYTITGNQLLLIDCGETVFRQLLLNNILDGVKDVNILITHNHSDHIGSLSSLIFYLHYVKNITATIHSISFNLKRILDLCGNTSNQYVFNIISPDADISIYNYKIIPIRTRHDNNIESCGYIIDSGDQKIYYSGDTYETPPEYILISCDKIYQDTCIADYDNNVHCSIYKLDKNIDPEYRNKIYCMHYDNSDELVDLIKYHGFNFL